MITTKSPQLRRAQLAGIAAHLGAAGNIDAILTLCHILIQCAGDPEIESAVNLVNEAERENTLASQHKH